MSQALELAYDGMPEPKLIIAVGACAISGGPYSPLTTVVALSAIGPLTCEFRAARS